MHDQRGDLLFKHLVSYPCVQLLACDVALHFILRGTAARIRVDLSLCFPTVWKERRDTPTSRAIDWRRGNDMEPNLIAVQVLSICALAFTGILMTSVAINTGDWQGAQTGSLGLKPPLTDLRLGLRP